MLCEGDGRGVNLMRKDELEGLGVEGRFVMLEECRKLSRVDGWGGRGVGMRGILWRNG